MLNKFIVGVAISILIIGLGACSTTTPTRVPTAAPILLTKPPTPQIIGGATSTMVAPTEAATQIPSPEPEENPDFLLAIDPGIPAEVIDAASQIIARDPQRFGQADPTETDGDGPGPDNLVHLSLNGGQPFIEWVYAIAAPFAIVADGTSLNEVEAGWQTGSNSLGRLIIDHETAAALNILWGPPGIEAQTVASADLVGALWAGRPAWTILPFQRLTPDLKTLALDGQSPLSHEFNQLTYPLKVSIGLAGDSQGVADFQAAWPRSRSNRDPNLLTRVAMSGVTALGRATAYQMELRGITTPGVVVGPVLQAADIAHVSHEVPFAADCPYPNPIGDPIFCARDGYLALIQSIGTDVVELTGNHVNDWGPENLSHSLDLYAGAGLKTFGGGRNLAEAREPAIFEHNGNRIAFVGCNPVGPAYAWATETSPGSRPCNFEEFYSQIRQLREAGYVVIATMQYSEFYHYQPTAQQRVDFRALVEAGAAAVSGSQGHHVQGFDFHQGSFIHYGLGNLFFDQMDMLGTRQSMIDTYTIYDGRLIGVDLFGSMIENYCCPRAISEVERAQLLQTLFTASGW